MKLPVILNNVSIIALFINIFTIFGWSRKFRVKNLIRSIIVSEFNVVEGPIVKIMIPHIEDEKIKKIEFIPRIMDIIHDQGQIFMGRMNDLYSLNYYIELDNKTVRGSKEMILFSIVVETNVEKEKPKVTAFLSGQEERLVNFVEGLREKRDIKEHGFFSDLTRIDLYERLHEFYRSIFIETGFIKSLDNSRGKVCVTGPNNYNPLADINYFKEILRNNNDNNLRLNMVLQVTRELEYNRFYCLDMHKETCEKEKCPVCHLCIAESEAALYFFNNKNFNDGMDLRDLQNILKIVFRVKTIPVLIMELNSFQDNDKRIDSLRNKLDNMVYTLKKESNAKHPLKHVIVSLKNPETFVDGMSWLIKNIM
ncbi:MAG: hypothetical protein ACTSVI_03900 [Promethearchaeota archaeon]